MVHFSSGLRIHGAARLVVYLLLSCLFATFFTGCASFGGRPDWIGTPPADTSDAVYFVSAGSDPTGNTGEAETRASRALASEIAKYIGVNITSDTSVEAKATFDSYQAQITETIREQSSALVSGFKIVDRYIGNDDSGGVFVYLLGEYGRAELEAEKTRFEQLFAEREQAISIPEGEGNALLEAGNLVRAAESFLQAAAAALSSDVANASIRFERVIGSTRESLDGVCIEKRTGYLTTVVNTAFAEDFVVQVTDATGTPLVGVPLLVTYRTASGSGRLSVRTNRIVTDEHGEARFEHPVPVSSGVRELIISLDLGAVLEPLGSARGKERDLLGSVEDVINTKRVTYQYSIVSESAAVPTGIGIIGVDEAGNSGDAGRTSIEIASVLTAAGFDVGVMSDEEISGKRPIDSRYRRQIKGTAQISSVEESDGSILVRIEASVTVVELSTGRTIFATNETRTVRSRTKAGSEEAAFVAMGTVLGEVLAAELP